MEARAEHDGRWYSTPSGVSYPSVTTVLGWSSDMSWIDSWRANIGDAAADKILTQAGRRGTDVHALAESYLNNDPAWHKDAMPINLATFMDIKRLLDKHVTVVRGLEYPSYSHRLKTAGRCDLVCDWDGVPTVVDFKTASSARSEEVLDKYALQATCYALMIKELTGLDVQRVVIPITVDYKYSGYRHPAYESIILVSHKVSALEDRVSRIFENWEMVRPVATEKKAAVS